MRILQTLPLILPLIALLGGCQASHRLGGLDGPGESCGNGMDDDGDREIDEGCFCVLDERQSCFSGTYPHRLVGQCADGNQACETSADEEFGAWGACDGDVLPDMEVCEGSVDEDCDGSIDEGCPCPAAGETRECGTEFNTFPCHRGRQTCALSGFWSGCEGAVGPGPELCNDSLDNDCDGSVNEGCDCLPAPEICGDGVDNDCDEEVDEPACQPPRQCDSCTWVSTSYVPTQLATPTPLSRTGPETTLFARQPNGTLASLSSNARGYLDLWSPDGGLLNRALLLPDASVWKVSLQTDGDGFLAVYRGAAMEPRIQLARFDAMGNLIRQRELSADHAIGAFRSGDRITAASITGERLWLQDFDLELLDVGAAREVGPALGVGPLSHGGQIEEIDGATVIASRAPDGLSRLTFVRDSVVTMTTLPELGDASRYRLIAERDDETFLICGSLSTTPAPAALCQRVRSSDGMLMGGVFTAPSVYGVQTACGLVFASGSSQTVAYSLHTMQRPGEFISQPVLWVSGMQLSTLLPTADGRPMLLLGHIPRTGGVAPFIHEFSCGTTPAIDCQRARELACQDVQTCCGGASSCSLGTATNPVVSEPGPCPLPRSFCATPRGECVQDLERGQTTCEGSVDSPSPQLPASCLFEG